jgi:hypothetical protein
MKFRIPFTKKKEIPQENRHKFLVEVIDDKEKEKDGV